MPTAEAHDIDRAALNRQAAHEAGIEFFNRITESWKRVAATKFRGAVADYDPFEMVGKPGFNFPQMSRQLRERFKLSEAVTETQLFALASTLMMDTAINAYKRKPVIYRSIADLVSTKTPEANFFTLQQGDIPLPVNETEEAPESRLGGVLKRIRTYKFARVYAVSEELADDDQTGQVRNFGQDAGGAMAYAEEQWWVIQLFAIYQAASIRSAGGDIPGMNVAGQSGTEQGYGGPATVAGAVTQANLEALFEAADYVTDIEGNFALVQPDTLFVASGPDKITARKLLEYPLNPTIVASTATPSTTTFVPGIFGGNPLMGLLKIVDSPFVKRARAGIAGGNPWGIGEAGKIGTFVDRTALVVETEPRAGKSFDTDTVRTKVKRRFGAGVRIPEFFLVGN